jgi:hypothetical protein
MTGKHSPSGLVDLSPATKEEEAAGKMVNETDLSSSRSIY